MTFHCFSRQPARTPLVLALALGGLLPWSQPVLAAPRADVEALGNLGVSTSGAGSSSARALNASGQVAGGSTYYVSGANKGNRAFVWSNGAMTNLGSLGTNAAGVGTSLANAINASGQVAGSSDFYVNGFSMGSRAFVWSNGEMTNLGSLGTDSSGWSLGSANAINTSGQVAGYSHYYVNRTYKGQRAFVWSNGVMTNLGSLGTDASGNGSSQAAAINTGGQVAGYSHYYVNGANKGQRAFVWSNGVMTNLGSLGTDASGNGGSQAAAINTSGQVAGNSTYYVNGTSMGSRAFVWSNGVMTNLGTLGTDSKGQGGSSARALNDSGQVVGSSDYYLAGVSQGSRAFLYNDGKMYQLNAFAPSGWTWSSASSINEFGQVAVTGIYNGQSQGGLFTPHPDWQGGSGNWADASHWNYAGMGAFGITPGAPHKVNIETTTATTVTGPANASVQSLSVGSTVAQGATLDLKGGVLRTADGTVLNSGGVLTGSGQVLGGLQTKAGSEVNVASGQHLQVDKAEFADKVHNDGELTIDTSATFTAGTYSGAGSLTGAGVLTFGSGSVFAPGNSPALVTVDVQTVLDAGSLLQMELGGTVAGTGYDKLVFGKSVSLGGDLELLWLNGFTASVGQAFDLFDWNGGVSGSFARIALPTLASGLEWDTSDLYQGGSLKVHSLVAAVPEPQTYALMLACLMVVGTVHKRRQA
jgi:probable HAF family extracellular repeat protein